jgi:hypothetical protein
VSASYLRRHFMLSTVTNRRNIHSLEAIMAVAMRALKGVASADAETARRASAKGAPSSAAWCNAPGTSGPRQPSAESAIHSGPICVGLTVIATLNRAFSAYR